MHEAGIIESMLAIAGRQARDNGAGIIRSIRLRVGVLRGVVPEALQHAFVVLRRETPAARDATLEVDYVAAVFWCTACQKEFETRALVAECPDCEAPVNEVRRGMELELVSLEVD